MSERRVTLAKLWEDLHRAGLDTIHIRAVHDLFEQGILPFQKLQNNMRSRVSVALDNCDVPDLPKRKLFGVLAAYGWIELRESDPIELSAYVSAKGDKVFEQ